MSNKFDHLNAETEFKIKASVLTHFYIHNKDELWSISVTHAT